MAQRVSSGRSRTRHHLPEDPAIGRASTHIAKASRASEATFSDNALRCHRLAGAGRYEVGHRGVRADRGTVVDGLAVAGGNLAREAEVLGDSLAGVPAFRDEHGDQDRVIRLDAVNDAAYLGLLVQEPDRNEVVDAPLPDALRVQVDDATRVLVQVGTVASRTRAVRPETSLPRIKSSVRSRITSGIPSKVPKGPA